MRIERRGGTMWLFMEVRDNGIDGLAHLRQGHGLTTMQDCVTALGGRLYLSDLHPGLRVHALLRQRQRGE
jgi:Signal transduction histidine kinase, glucose-6-phosphate specific